MEDLILYHGSDTLFNQFEEEKIGTGHSAGNSKHLLGRGFYLTDKEEIAKFYGKLTAKKKYITGYSPTGIFKTDEPTYSVGADAKAELECRINKFSLTAPKIYDITTAKTDKQFQEHIVHTFMRYCEFDEETARRPFKFLEENRSRIHNFRGDLLYILGQLGFADTHSLFKDSIVAYIQNLGYNAIKYPADKNFEAETEGGSNYVVYDKKIIKGHQQQIKTKPVSRKSIRPRY